MATKYSVLIGGSEVDLWESIDFENSLDLSVNKAKIQFPDSSALLAAEGIAQDIQIRRDSVNIWRGLGISNEKIYDLNGKKQYNLNCLSNKIYLQKEIFQKGGSFAVTYGGTSNSSTQPSPANGTLGTSIFSDILNSQTSPAALIQGLEGTYQSPHAALIITRQTALQVLSQLVSATLWETRFNYDNTVDFGTNSIGAGTQGTVGSPSSVYTFQSDENLIKTEVDFGIDKLVNQVIVCGAGSQGNQLTNTAVTQNASSITKYGAWSKIINLPNCKDSNLLQAYSNALLNDLSGEVYTMKTKLADLSSGVPFKMGDYVTINEPNFNLNGALFRVIQEQRHYDSSQGEDVNITLAQNYRMVNVAHFKAKRLEDILNSQLQNQQVFNNNFNQTPGATLATDTGVVDGPLVVVPKQGQGQSPTSTLYLIISASGIYQGATLSLGWVNILNASLDVTQITDITTNTVLSNGTSYSAPASQDIEDHIIEFSATFLGTSGTQAGNAEVTGEIALATPTIPQ